MSQTAAMKDALPTVADTLMDEVTRYLTVVEAFRAAGCEPSWRVEWAPIALEPEGGQRTSFEKSAH